MMQIFSHHPCALGEGTLWHPTRQQVFWFDILGKQLRTQRDGRDQLWQFDDYVSAAGWVDDTRLILADAKALWLFDLTSGDRDHLITLEADNPLTRSNDGRADPQGGFWIGTMGIRAEPGAGAIYRYHQGELRRLYDQITIPNAICFAPDGRSACFTDTVTGRVMRQALDSAGWPVGVPQLYLDLSDQGLGPDGAVMDAQGNFWNAQWGASRVACYDPQGALIQTIDLPTPQASCPAFGGADLSQLFVTTAADGITDDPKAGLTYHIATQAKGQPEHRVIL